MRIKKILPDYTITSSGIVDAGKLVVLNSEGKIDSSLLDIVDWQESVLDRDLTAPPITLTSGIRYIVDTPATGDWTGKEELIAEYTGSEWRYTAPNNGTVAYVEDEALLVVYTDTWPAGTWNTFSAAISDHGLLTGLSDDDHGQYLLVDPTSRSLVANLNAADFSVTGINALETDYVQFDITASDTGSEGRLKWNSSDGTLEVGLPGGNVNLQIGQEHLVRVRNNSGVNILNGQVVYQSGATGQRPKIALADNTDSAKCHPLGVATEDINDGHFGYITTAGLVRDIDTHLFNEGDELYLDTAGQLTKTKPTAPLCIVSIGKCIHSDLNTGIILVSIDEYHKISDASDVNITSIQNNDVLQWSSANSRWENKNTLTTSGILASGLNITAPTITNAGSDDYLAIFNQTLNDTSAAAGTQTYNGLKINLTTTDTTGWDAVYALSVYDDGTKKASITNTGAASVASLATSELYASSSAYWSVLPYAAISQVAMTVGSSANNHFVYSLFSNGLKNHDHTNRTDPWMYFHSRTDPDIDNTQYLGISHVANAGVIETGLGDIQLNSASGNVLVASGVSTPMIKFGGTTSSFPALKRNAATLEARLADDSNYTGFNAQSFFAYSNIGVAGAGYYNFSGRSKLYSDTDSAIRLTNNALNDFSLLQFGGTTNAYPAWQRSNTQLTAKLADNSALAPLGCGTFTTSGISSFTAPTLTDAGTDDYAMVINQTLNDTSAAAGTQTYNGLKINLTTTDTTGWDNIFALSVYDDTSRTFSLTNAGALSCGNVITSSSVSVGGWGVGTLGYNSAAQQVAMLVGPSALNCLVVQPYIAANLTADFDHVNRTDAWLYMQSRTDPDVDNTQYLGIAHVSNAGVIETGLGDIQLNAASGNVLVASGVSAPMIKFGGTTNAFPALKRESANLSVVRADDSGYSGLICSGIQFGGTTSSFPAFRRNGATILARLADDSGYATLYADSFNSQASYQFAIGTYIRSSVNGNVELYKSGGTDFSLLQFGGTSNAYPALERDAANLGVVRANDSGYTSIICSGVYLGGTTVAESFIRSVSGSPPYVEFRTGTLSSYVPIYAGNVIANGSIYAANANPIAWTSGSAIYGLTAGTIRLTNGPGGTDFTLLQFGNTTSAYPALKRRGVSLETRLADDSAYCNLNTGNILVASGVAAPTIQFGEVTNAAPMLKRSSATLQLRLADDSSFAALVCSSVSAQTGLGSAATGYIGWTSRSLIYSDADSQIRLSNAAGTDFSLLQFGGTTNAYPAIKRSTTTLEVKRADDSGYTSLTVSGITYSPSKEFDFVIPAGSANLGATAPTWAVNGSAAGLAFNSDAEQAHLMFEVPHEWDGVSNLTFNIYWTNQAGDAITAGETVKWDITYRCLNWDDGVTSTTGTAATGTVTYTQSGSGSDGDLHKDTITIVYNHVNQPIVAGNVLSIQFDRDVTTDNYSGDPIVALFEIGIMLTGAPTHV